MPQFATRISREGSYSRTRGSAPPHKLERRTGCDLIEQGGIQKLSIDCARMQGSIRNHGGAASTIRFDQSQNRPGHATRSTPATIFASVKACRSAQAADNPVAMRAMAELGPGPHRSGDIASVLGVDVTTVAPLRSGLIRKGMVYSPQHG